MNADTNYYRIALAEYQAAHPNQCREFDILNNSEARAAIIKRAQILKAAQAIRDFGEECIELCQNKK